MNDKEDLMKGNQFDEIRRLKGLFDQSRPFPAKEYDAVMNLANNLKTENERMKQHLKEALEMVYEGTVPTKDAIQRWEEACQDNIHE